MNGHDQFFKGSIAGPLADAVDGHFGLPGTTAQCCKSVGRGKTQVIVTVNTYNGFVYIGGMAHDIFDQIGKFHGYGIAYGVRNVYGCCAGVNGGFKNLAQKVSITPGRILG